MGVKTMYLHKDARAQKMAHLLQDFFLKDVPCHCALQIKNKWITKPAEITKTKQCISFESCFWLRILKFSCCSVPAALLPSAGSVTHQQNNLLSLPTILIGTLRRGSRLLYLCGYPIIICAILQVVLVEICMGASCGKQEQI